MNSVIRILKSLPALTRWGVSLAVSFSTAAGYLVYEGYADLRLFYATLGVLLLSGGASALNQFQEREIDFLMKRTRNRPIPSKTISANTGFVISIILCLLGLFVLYIKAGFLPALLGFFNLIWYNGFYTYLKRKTAFAVVIGSLTGVTPLLIGWTAAGGYILSPTIIFISFFIYMWQIPHFWLLLIKYHEDYKNADLGNLYSIFSKNQAKHVVFVWIVATSLTSLLLPYFGIIQSTVTILIMLFINIGFVISFYRIIFNKSNQIHFRIASIEINIFMITVLTLLIIDQFIK